MDLRQVRIADEVIAFYLAQASSLRIRVRDAQAIAIRSFLTIAEAGGHVDYRISPQGGRLWSLRIDPALSLQIVRRATTDDVRVNRVIYTALVVYYNEAQRAAQRMLERPVV